MKKHIIILAILVSGIALFAQESQHEYPTRKKIINGIKTIINPNYFRDSHVNYTFNEELTIGDNDENENNLLNRPNDIKVDSMGNIYALDWGDTNIKIYDINGQFIRSIGKEGQGPGEFATPAYFDITPDRKIFIMSMRQRRVLQLDIDGNYLGGFRFEGSNVRLQVDNKNRIYYQKIIQGTPIEKISQNQSSEVDVIAGIYRTDYRGKDKFHFGDFKGEKVIQKRTKSGGLIGGKGPYEVKWRIKKNGDLILGFTGEYLLNYYSQNGNLEFKFGRDYIPVKNIIDRKTVSKELLPFINKYKPVFRDILFDEKGNIWIRLYPREDIPEELYDIFSSDGIYINQASIPHPIYHLENGKAYCITRREEYYRIIRYEIVKKTN